MYNLSAASWAAVLILPQIKFNSQLSSCTSCFRSTVMETMEGPRMDFLPLTGLHVELEVWYQQWPVAPINLLRECRWIWVSLSWFLNLPYWLRFWVLFGGGTGYLPPPSRKDTGGGGWNIWGIPTYGLDTEWGSVERYWGIPTQRWEFPPKILGGGLAERCQNFPPTGKVLSRGTRSGKKSRKTRGPTERCWGSSIVGDWMVLADLLSKRLIWHFSSIWLPL